MTKIRIGFLDLYKNSFTKIKDLKRFRNDTVFILEFKGSVEHVQKGYPTLINTS